MIDEALVQREAARADADLPAPAGGVRARQRARTSTTRAGARTSTASRRSRSTTWATAIRPWWRPSASRPASSSTSNLYYTEPMIALAEWIRDRSLGGRVLFGNSGAEACEAALKLARKHGGPGRKDVVAIVDGFHGRTMGALSLTGQAGKQDAFAPLVPGVRFVERDDLAGLEAAVDERTCGDLPRGRPGRDRRLPAARGVPAPRPRAGRPPRRPARARRDPDRPLAHRAPLRAPGRAGVAPDVMCLAKSLGGGVPIGAIVAAPGGGRHASARRPRLDLRRQPAGLAPPAWPPATPLEDPALQDDVRRAGARLLAGLEGLVADGPGRARRAGAG